MGMGPNYVSLRTMNIKNRLKSLVQVLNFEPHPYIYIHIHIPLNINVGKTIINHTWLGRAYTTYLWFGGWFIIVLPTLINRYIHDHPMPIPTSELQVLQLALQPHRGQVLRQRRQVATWQSKGHPETGHLKKGCHENVFCFFFPDLY